MSSLKRQSGPLAEADLYGLKVWFVQTGVSFLLYGIYATFTLIAIYFILYVMIYCVSISELLMS